MRQWLNLGTVFDFDFSEVLIIGGLAALGVPLFLARKFFGKLAEKAAEELFTSPGDAEPRPVKVEAGGASFENVTAGGALTKDGEVPTHLAAPPPTEEPREEPALKISTGRLPHTEGAELFGREDEMARLDAAWEDPRTHVISLIT